MTHHPAKRLLTGALALVVSAPVALLAAPSNKTLWKAASAGYRWDGTAKDIRVVSDLGGNNALFLAHLLFPKASKAGPDDDDGYTVYKCTVRPLSLVGSLLSYRRDAYWEGGAHPSGAIGFDVLDAAHPKKAPVLTDLFPDAEVRAALLADSIIKGIIKREKISPPNTSAALVEALKLKYFGDKEDDSRFMIPGDLLSQYAFHHLEGGKVAVRLNCPWGSEINRFQSTQLGLMLKVPAQLRAPLERAASGKEGYLMREATRQFRNAESILYSKE